MQAFAGQLLALLTAGCWAHNSIVYGTAGHRVGSGAVTHIRLWIALPAMVLVHLVTRGTILPIAVAKPALLLLGLSGFLGFFVADMFIFYAFVDLGHRETLVILTLSPLVSALLSRIALAEVLTPAQGMGMIVTLAGIGWVIYAEHRRSKVKRRRALGVAFALLGAIAQAAGMVLAKLGLGSEVQVHPLSANLIRLAAGFAGVVVFRFLTKRGVEDFRAMRDTRALGLIAQGAIVGPVAGIVSNLYALTLAPVGVVTTIMQTSPILLLPFDRFVLKRSIPIGAWLGTVAAVGGAILLFVA